MLYKRRPQTAKQLAAKCGYKIVVKGKKVQAGTPIVFGDAFVDPEMQYKGKIRIVPDENGRYMIDFALANQRFFDKQELLKFAHKLLAIAGEGIDGSEIEIK